MALDDGWADGVAFGKAFIANPDLPGRMRVGAALNAPNPASFLVGAADGYTDYPFMDAAPAPAHEAAEAAS